MTAPIAVTIALTADQIEALAQRVAAIIDERTGAHTASPYVTIPEAAELLRTTRPRVDNLLSRYEVDAQYISGLEKCGLIFSGMSPDGKLPEIVEVQDHPWFIGVQFHPELKSKPFAPHPLFADFVRAAMGVERLV